MQHSKTIELWVGLFVGLGLIALFFLAMKVSNLADLHIDDRSYMITARFENAGSLKPRAPVSMAGVRIGRVSAVRFDKDSYEAVVEMRIDPAYDTLPDDTSASVLTQGLLGEQYVGLSPGGSDVYLQDGDEIELTQSALVLEQIIGRFLFNKAEEASEAKDEDTGSAEVDQESKPRSSAARAEP
jgi:phospholipid/cholesterol/gamma-HCH transport system substrate-binding protein